MDKLQNAILDFEDFIQAPSEYEDQHRVREYRHEAYPKWALAVREFQRLQAQCEVYRESLKMVDNLSSGLRFDLYDASEFRMEMKEINAEAKQSLNQTKE